MGTAPIKVLYSFIPNDGMYGTGRDVYGSVVSASEFKSQDPGFSPLAARQGEEQFPCPSAGADLRVRHAPKFVHTLKIPYPSVVKE